MNRWNYLFEVFSQSNLEKMAQQNLEHNFSDYKNWMNLITLTKNRGKAIEVTLTNPIRSIDLGAVGVFVPSVKKFIVMEIAGRYNDLDAVGVNPQGKLTGHFVLGVNEVYKAGPSIEIVKRPKANPWVGKLVAAPPPPKKKDDLAGYLRLLNDNHENMIWWRKAFMAASKENKELVVSGLDYKYAVAVTDVYSSMKRIGTETRGSGSNYGWSSGYDVKGFNRKKLSVHAKTKGWMKKKKDTWRNDSISKLLQRNPKLKGTDHFWTFMARQSESLFMLMEFSGGWTVSLQAGDHHFSAPREDGLLVDAYTHWEMKIRKRMPAGLSPTTFLPVHEFNINTGAGLMNRELFMNYRNKFSRQTSRADLLSGTAVNKVFKWLLQAFGTPTYRRTPSGSF